MGISARVWIGLYAMCLVWYFDWPLCTYLGSTDSLDANGPCEDFSKTTKSSSGR